MKQRPRLPALMHTLASVLTTKPIAYEQPLMYHLTLLITLTTASSYSASHSRGPPAFGSLGLGPETIIVAMANAVRDNSIAPSPQGRLLRDCGAEVSESCTAAAA